MNTSNAVMSIDILLYLKVTLFNTVYSVIKMQCKTIFSKLHNSKMYVKWLALKTFYCMFMFYCTQSLLQ